MDDKHRILICEDNTATRTVIKFNFENAGFDVTDVPSGLHGWERVQREHFDLIVSDQQMPDMGGAELCERIRQLEEYDDTPFLLLTAKSFELNAERLKEELGVSDVMCKPFSPSQLVRRAKSLLAIPMDTQ